MKKIIKGHNSGHQDCHLEITDAGLLGLVWLNVVYEKREEIRPYIVVKKHELRRALNTIERHKLI